MGHSEPPAPARYNGQPTPRYSAWSSRSNGTRFFKSLVCANLVRRLPQAHALQASLALSACLATLWLRPILGHEYPLPAHARGASSGIQRAPGSRLPLSEAVLNRVPRWGRRPPDHDE